MSVQGMSAMGMCLPRGRMSRGLSGQGGVCQQGGYLPRGCMPGDVYPSMHWAGGVCPSNCWDLPPRTEFLTHACENITFPQLCCRR